MAASAGHKNQEEQPQSIQQLAADVVTLVRSEIDAAKSELAEKAKSAGSGAAMVIASAITGLLTLASLTVLAIVALALVMQLWLSVSIVTGIWALITFTLALLGKRKLADAAPFIPEQTIANVRADIHKTAARAARE